MGSLTPMRRRGHKVLSTMTLLNPKVRFTILTIPGDHASEFLSAKKVVACYRIQRGRREIAFYLVPNDVDNGHPDYDVATPSLFTPKPYEVNLLEHLKAQAKILAERNEIHPYYDKD